jgi:DNA-binding CsgD family transcriptional regulator
LGNKPSKPTKYELNVEPRLHEIKQWVKDGMTDEELAVRLDIHVSTIYEYSNKHPKFARY